MSAPPTGSAPHPPAYVRGEAAHPVDARRVLVLATGLVLAALVALVTATTLGALHQSSVQRQLRRDGVPVVATVTGCRPVTSGIGQAVEYYTCGAAYTLDGHPYRAALGGNRAVRPAGQRLRAVAVRGNPRLLSLAGPATETPSALSPYATPIVLAAVTAVLGSGVWWWSRRRRRAFRLRPAG